MTENTKVLSIRLENRDKEELSKYLNRESAESLLRQIQRGEIVLTRKGVELKGVYTTSKSVNTDIEAVLEKIKAESPVITGVNTNLESVNTCEDCPYMNDLNMDGFNEVCEYKGIDKQKALDKCVQMLWR